MIILILMIEAYVINFCCKSHQKMRYILILVAFTLLDLTDAEINGIHTHQGLERIFNLLFQNTMDRFIAKTRMYSDQLPRICTITDFSRLDE